MLLKKKTRENVEIIKGNVRKETFLIRLQNWTIGTKPFQLLDEATSLAAYGDDISHRMKKREQSNSPIKVGCNERIES